MNITDKMIKDWHFQMAKAVIEDAEDRTSPAMRRDFYRDFAAEAFDCSTAEVTSAQRHLVKEIFFWTLYSQPVDWKNKYGVKITTLQTDFHDGHICQDVDHKDGGDQDRLPCDVHGERQEKVPPVREA